MIDSAEKHLRDILAIAFDHSPDRQAVVVFDRRSELSLLLAEAYKRCLPRQTFIDFDQAGAQEILAAFARLRPLDLVVLIQSTNFRLEAFRIRVELFKRGLKVIEHPHLARMRGQEAAWYVDSLAYDPAYYRGVGKALKARLDRAGSAVIETGSTTNALGPGYDANGGNPAAADAGRGDAHIPGAVDRLILSSPFESAKLNVGDYAEMKNIGGQFPIGEVFTEARDLEAVNGRMRIFIFADIDFMVNRPERPITLVIERGRVIKAIDSTPAFEKVLANIRADEGEVWIRELGFGMNRAFSQDRMVRDIGTLERMCGVHLSLGAKHAVYQKPDFRRKDTKHHVDVFAQTRRVLIDHEIVFENGMWTIGG